MVDGWSVEPCVMVGGWWFPLGSNIQDGGSRGGGRMLFSKAEFCAQSRRRRWFHLHSLVCVNAAPSLPRGLSIFTYKLEPEMRHLKSILLDSLQQSLAMSLISRRITCPYSNQCCGSGYCSAIWSGSGPDLDCHFDADPDPDLTFHFYADPDPSVQIKAQNLEKVHIPTFWLFIFKLMRIRNSDPHSAYHFDPDPYPAYHFDADPDPDPTFQFDPGYTNAGSNIRRSWASSST